MVKGKWKKEVDVLEEKENRAEIAACERRVKELKIKLEI